MTRLDELLDDLEYVTVRELRGHDNGYLICEKYNINILETLGIQFFESIEEYMLYIIETSTERSGLISTLRTLLNQDVGSGDERYRPVPIEECSFYIKNRYPKICQSKTEALNEYADSEELRKAITKHLLWLIKEERRENE